MDWNPFLWCYLAYPYKSQPARAVWIEIYKKRIIYPCLKSQPARAVWIEISYSACHIRCYPRHSLRGLCGLKSPELIHPRFSYLVTACEGCVDWNDSGRSFVKKHGRHSLRGLCGLKLHPFSALHYPGQVTACEGCVDWNLKSLNISCDTGVTACEGCVDWNSRVKITATGITTVTACEGCVDWNLKTRSINVDTTGHSLRGLCGLKSSRNVTGQISRRSQPARAVWIEIPLLLTVCVTPSSQPARAVWIEIPQDNFWNIAYRVTACEGCVDWNIIIVHSLHLMLWSQPARAVWIEIYHSRPWSIPHVVTACEGCVDWNHLGILKGRMQCGHSLRGLCGLKC